MNLVHYSLDFDKTGSTEIIKFCNIKNIFMLLVPYIASGPGIYNLNVIADNISFHGHFGRCFLKPNLTDPPHVVEAGQSAL